MERDLKLRPEEKLMDLEKKVSQDAAMVERLCKEWDELIQTVERLRSERCAAHEERD